jgi:RimJ/RimL family protein N-acetyltransferase
MTSVQLLPITPALQAALDAPDEFERTFHVHLGAHLDFVRAVVTQTEAHRARVGAPPEWGGFLAIDPESQRIVGVCGYKGAPGADAGVEIAYGTIPEFERRGWAGRMAAALVHRAVDSGRVRVLHAHTLPEPNASTRTLARLGFVCTGTVIDDPEDGPVWHWERPADAGVAP